MLSRATVLAMLALVGWTALARAQGVCDQLWYERNAIYKAAGCWFKAARAVSRAGSASASPPSSGRNAPAAAADGRIP